MKLSLFDYDLPRKLIAQYPTRRRDQSRLLVLDRSTGELAHRRFSDIVNYLRPGDALVVNNTKVFKARLFGKRATGGKVELFLVRPIDDNLAEAWEALAYPSRRLKEGEFISFPDTGQVVLEADLTGGRWRVVFSSRTARERIISRHGHVPLPKYVNRDVVPTDVRRYQTVFSRKDKTGAVAAPTAGFHFTHKLLDEIAASGVKVCEITLHVGPGTFKPITTATIEDHLIDQEYAELSESIAATLNRVRREGGRIFAVGTTSVRTLESARIVNDHIQSLAEMVKLYIQPGHEFHLVDHLITNFHIPKSSLLVLVSAFAGREKILETYAEAVGREYRFYSYGDAMLIL